MLERILPRQLDNRYGGRTGALWLFGLLTLMSGGIALVSIFAADGGAQSADGIPLNTFGPAAAQAVIGVVGFLGVAKLWMAVIGSVALVRYRALVPALYLLLMADWALHKGVALMKPIPRVAAAGGAVPWVMLGVMVVGYGLSVWGGKRGRA